ncbi:hypothetical protein GCM10010191_83420 [Actinomadura vinacea]|uniref:DUF397 domain-containing protein n=1 Tax=Actinomadura vinacea TaxID=115336 RepID=A0ABN3KBE3_9ACTN
MSEQNLARLQWRTSSHSGGQGTQCVQVAALEAKKAVAARDSKNPDGGMLTFSRGEWAAFLGRVKAGTFDRT